MNRPLFSPAITRILEIGAIGAVIVLYVVLKANTLRVTASDEGVYYYAAKLWLDGLLPYRDFFISHPPVHLIVPTIAIWLFGINIYLLNAIDSIVVSAISGLLIFRIAEREWGFLAGFFSSLFFLFSNNQLLQSNHMTGISLTLLFLLAGVDCFLAAQKSGDGTKQLLLSGALLGMGFMSGAYVLPGILLIGLFTLVTHPPSLRPLLMGFNLIVVPMHLFFLALAGKAFLTDVYLYHIQKTAASLYFANVPTIIVGFIAAERWLVFPALFGVHAFLFVPILRKQSLPASFPVALLSCLFLMDYLIFFSLMNRVFTHYLLFVLPFAALLGTFGFLSFFRLRFTFFQKWKGKGEYVYQTLVALGFGGALVWFLLASVAPYARIAFTFKFTGAPDIALYLRNVLNPEETLYGDFGVTPTVALLSGIRIAGNEVDSSIMRFESGISSPIAVIESIEADNVGALVLRRGTDVELQPTFRKYVGKYFTLDREFVGADVSGNVEVWRRKKDVPFEGVDEISEEAHQEITGSDKS